MLGVLVCLGGEGGLQEHTERREETMISDKGNESGRGGKRSGIAEWVDMHSDSCMITNHLGDLTGSQLPHQQNRNLNRICVMGSVCGSQLVYYGTSGLCSKLTGALWNI